MNNKLIFLLLILTNVTYASKHNNWAESMYFNTTFLRNYDLVEQMLIEEEGFEHVTFPSSDGLKLSGILLKRPGAKTTIIFCAGFFPGRKEGQAPVYKMLPTTYNVLLFDARGHAKSEGPFFSTLGHYGRNEYKDVLGAIDFVQKQVGGAIIIYGVCAGSVHATHALLNIEKEKKSNIIGLVFDSGFGSTLDLESALSYHIREKFMPNYFTWYANKEKIRETYFFRACSFFATKLLSGLNELLFMGKIRKYNHETKLSDKIHKLDIPTFFIHCKNDAYSPFEKIVTLAESVENKEVWWLEDSSHSNNALKHKHEYKKRLLNFFDSICREPDSNRHSNECTTRT